MAKITTTSSGTKFDPTLDAMAELDRLGLKPTTETKEFAVQAQQDRLNSFSNIKISDFKPNSSLFGSDAEALPLLEEQRAREQGVVNQMLKGLGRVGSTALTEVLKVPGYLGGALGAPLMEGDFIENAVNNAWVNAFEDADEAIKSTMPVYLTRDVQEGDIGRKLLSSAWWSTTGADGVGFLLSMFVPGQFAKALGIGSTLAKGVEGLAKVAGAESKFTKVLTAGNYLKDTLGGIKATTKTIEGLQSTAAVALNTYIESASEAANTFDNVKQQYLSANPNASDEEANKHAGIAAASVMKANVGVLALSNLMDEIFIFKGFGQTAEKTAKESIIGKLFQNGEFNTEAIAKLKREGIKEFGKKALPKLAANFAKEGLFEEGLQTRIQQHYENVSSGKTQAGFWEDAVGGYFDSLMNDPEMQESVVLGGILGGGASMVEVANSIQHRNELLFGKSDRYPSYIAKFLNRKEQTKSPGLTNILQENFVNSFRTIHDIAELDADGKPVIENGKVKIDEAKFAQMIEQKQAVLTLNQLHNISILEGNKAEEDMYGDQLAFNYFLPFMQQEGGYEVLKQHIESQLVDMMAKKVEDATGHVPSDVDKAGIKNKLLKRAEEFHKIYEDVNETTNTEMYVRPSDKNYGAWKSSVRDRKMQSLIAYNSATKALTEINTKFPTELTDEEFKQLDPRSALDYLIAQKVRPQFEKLAEQAKETYSKLSNKKGLQEDYSNYNKNIEETAKDIVEEEQKQDEEIPSVLNTEDFEKSLNDAGYETIRNSTAKGFYIKDQRIVVENPHGQRGVIESVYDASKQRTDQYFINSGGTRTKITDDNGNIKDSFLKLGFKPITKEQLTKERKAIAIQERKKAQLKLLQELIDYRNQTVASHKKEIADIDNQISDYENQLKKAQEELIELMNNRTSNKAKSVKKKQLKANKELLENTIKSIEDTIVNLVERRDHLSGLIPRIEALINEYTAIKQMIADSESFSLKQEIKRVEEELFTKNIDEWDLSQKDIDEINSLISDIDKKIEELEKVKQAVANTLSANEAFIEMIKLNEEDYERAFRAFDEFFKGIPFPYAIQRIHQLITSDLTETVAGETLAKNNIITNAAEIAKWFNENPNESVKRLGIDGIVTEEDIYRKIVDILHPYTRSLADLQKRSPLTLEDIHDMQSQVYIANREINELNKLLNEQKARLDVNKLYHRYLVLERLVQEKFEKRYNQLRNEQAEKTLDPSQKGRGNFAEPGTEADMRDVFYQHALPATPMSTTGVSVLYEKDGHRKGKDKIDENGFPQLNDNEFQRTWFLTIDKLSDSIGDFMLMPVRAKYDSSDEFQKAIEANFPNEAQRTDHDVFVFLVNKEGKPLRVDKNANILTSGGSLVFTSLRKPEEVFPPTGKPRIAPDYVLNSYLNSLGIKYPYKYENVVNKTVKEFANTKILQNTLKEYIDRDATMQDLFEDAINYGRNEYTKFLNGLTNGFLEIESTTRGYPLYQLDKDGKKLQHKPLTVFNNVTLEKGKFGKDQLQGARLGVTVKDSIQSKGQLISLPQGTIYIQFQNEEFVTLQSRNINNEEAKTILYLLSLADTQNPLNSITIPFPKKKDGKQYYYYFGKTSTIEETIPVFARRMPNGNPFSLLNTMINYGFKSEGKNKKGEIYIQNGKVHYTAFDGTSNQVSLKDITEAIKSEKFDKHNDAVEGLFQFLLEKRFNVEKNLLQSNPIFMYPKLKRHGKGDYSIQFDTTSTYYEHMLNNVLTTSATTKEGYPNHLQRNVIYRPTQIRIEQTVKTPAVKTKKDKPVATKPAKVNEVKNQTNETWLAEKKANILAAKAKYASGLNAKERSEFYNTTIQPQIDKQIADQKLKIDPAQLDELKKLFVEESAPETEDQLFSEEELQSPEEIVSENPVPLKGLTPAEKLAALKGKNKTQLKPKTGMAKTKSADKIVDVAKLLDNYVEQGIVQKECK